LRGVSAAAHTATSARQCKAYINASVIYVLAQYAQE